MGGLVDMAITSKIPKVKVDILVNNVALQQYEDDEESQVSPATVTKYIEAQSGAEFAVRYTLEEKPQHDIKVDIFLDGKYADNKLVLLDKFSNGTFHQTMNGVASVNSGRWVLAKFSFSDLKTVDSISRPCRDQSINDLKELGQVTVKFSYMTNLRLSTQVSRPLAKDKGVGEVPEKALKGRAISHQTILRDPVPTEEVRVWSSDYVDPDRQPFLIINFKYRSRDALKSLMIIPRSPSPVPLEERDVDTLSPEEMRQLLRRQRERDVAARAVKRERGVKRERSTERGRSATVVDGDDGDVSFVSAKRRRLPVTLDEDSNETIDLT